MQTNTPFHHRGKEVSRIEALSDAVFALAITLIVVSVEVPSGFADLMKVVKAFPVFAVCFGMIAWIWFKHYNWFRRYGLQDGMTIALNCILLFIVLFYVYPLKFLFASFLAGLAGGAAGEPMTAADMRTVFIIYGAGFASVFITFAILHVHALRKGPALELSRLELFDTKSEIYENLALAGIGIISILLALVLPPPFLQFAGWSYFLTGAVKAAAGTYNGRMRRTFE